jgi:hypothetical protein
MINPACGSGLVERVHAVSGPADDLVGLAGADTCLAGTGRSDNEGGDGDSPAHESILTTRG